MSKDSKKKIKLQYKLTILQINLNKKYAKKTTIEIEKKVSITI